MTRRTLAACSAVLALAALNGCARAPAARPPQTYSDPAVTAASAVPRAAGEDVAQTALAWIGVPYRNGGSDPSGFDCSGFVQYVFAQHGIRLPRGVEEQAHAGQRVRASAIAAGDLVFFATTGEGASHVGIASGPDAFVHSPSAGGQVRQDRLSAPYWAKRFLEARRLMAGAGVTPQ
jgi:cell wall-associated NlpC family hydrolase